MSNMKQYRICHKLPSVPEEYICRVGRSCCCCARVNRQCCVVVFVSGTQCCSRRQIDGSS